MAAADLTQAELTLSYTAVQSPISGYISQRSADIGTLVGPSGKSLLATVVKSDTVLVDFSMTALDYLRSKNRNVNLGHRSGDREWTSLHRRSTRRREPSRYVPRCRTPTMFFFLGNPPA